MLTIDAFESLIKQKEEVKLTVKSGSEVAEIFILDHKYNRIDARVGNNAEFKLAPGVYIIKVRIGTNCEEKSIVLSKDEAVEFYPISFTSAAPLEGTTKIHEYHTGNAEIQSKRVHISLGRGSQIFIFVRKWTSGYSSFDQTSLNPAKGLTLTDQNGNLLTDFEKTSTRDLRGDPWAACNIELNPGLYILRLQTATGTTLEQTIVASPDWQLQIFLLQRNYGYKEEDFRADLLNSSIFLSQIREMDSDINHGFKSTKPLKHEHEKANLHLSELAQQALANDRSVLANQLLNQALDEKFSNPMLGIYGAHLLIRSPEYDKNLFSIVIMNLRRLLGENHPDVEALALKGGLGSGMTFSIPSMLRTSWKYVLEASVKNPSLVPEKSIAAQNAGRFSSEGVWLVWSRTDKDEAILVDQLKKFLKLKISSMPEITEIKVRKHIKKSKGISFKDFDALSLPQEKKPETPGFTSRFGIDSGQMTSIVQSLGIPRSRVDMMLNNISKDDSLLTNLKSEKASKKNKKR